MSGALAPPAGVPAPLMWLGAGAGAVVLHLALLQQGLMQFGPPPPPAAIAPPKVEVLAMPLSVAGAETPDRLGAVDGAETAETADTAERLEATDADAATRAEVEQIQATKADTADTNAALDRVAATKAEGLTETAQPAPDRVTATQAPPVAPAAPRVIANAAPVQRSAALPAPVQTSRVGAVAPRTAVTPSVAAIPPPQTTLPRVGDVAPPRLSATPRVAAAPRVVATPTPRPAVTAAAPVTAPVEAAPPVAASTTSAAPVLRAAPGVDAQGAASAAPAIRNPARVQGTAPSVASAASTPAARVAAAPPAAPAAAPPVGRPSLPPVSGAESAGIAAPPETRLQAATQTYETVLEMLARYSGGSCFAALPSLGAGEAFQLETFARNTNDLDGFRAALETRTGRLPNTRMKPVSDAQCRALAFVQDSPAYPAFQLYFELEAHQIASGDRLSGRIGNTTGGFLSFLLIDDEGLVQDLGSFLKFTRGAAVFSVPMTLSGGPVETQQLLMALSTPARPDTVRTGSGTPADTFFTNLAAELAAKGIREDLAVVAFSVR